MSAVNAAANGFLVVTYVQHEGEDQPEVVAHKQMLKPGAEGDFVDGSLGFTENYQCKGEKSAGGCKELHGHATERVRTRLLGDDGKVAVVWRRFHPLVSQGEAEPGKPFEHTDGKATVRVEVHEIVKGEAEKKSKGAVSALELRKLTADLAKQQAVHEQRMAVRSRLALFEDVQLAAMREQIAAQAERLKDLPDAKAVAAAGKESLAAVDALAAEVEKGAKAILAKGAANGEAEIQRVVAAAAGKLAACAQPLALLEQKAAALIAFQGQVRAALKEVQDLPAGLEAHRAELPGLDPKALSIAALSAKLEGVLEDTRDKGSMAKVPALEKKLLALRPELAALKAEAEALVEAERDRKAAFETQVAMVGRWKKDPEGAAGELLRYVEAGAMFAGFALKHWSDQVERLDFKLERKLPALDKLAYHHEDDQAQLEKALGALGPVRALLEQINADMKRRNQGEYNEVQANNERFAAPGAWLKTLAVGRNGVHAELCVRNNADRPMRVVVKDADGEALKEITLAGRGRLAVLELRGLKGEISLEVTGVGPAGARPAKGEAARLTTVSVPCEPVAVIAKQGTIRHMAPYTFTPAEEQPRARAMNAVVEEKGAQYYDQALPGR